MPKCLKSLSAQVPSECPPRDQNSFRLVLTLSMKKKHSTEIVFKQIITRFTNSKVHFILRSCNIFRDTEKQIKILRFSDGKLSWILRYPRVFFNLSDAMTHFSNYLFFRRKWLFHNRQSESNNRSAIMDLYTPTVILTVY